MDFDGDMATAPIPPEVLRTEGPTESESGDAELTPASILNSERSAVIQHIAKRIDQGESIPANIMNALLKRYYTGVLNCVYFDDESQDLNQEGNNDDDGDEGWIQLDAYKDSTNAQLRKLIDEVGEGEEANDGGYPMLQRVLHSRDYSLPVEPNTLAQYPNGIYDYDDLDGMLTVLIDSIATSSDPAASTVVENALRLFNELPRDDHSFSGRLIIACAESPQSQILYGPICSYLAQHEHEYQYSLQRGGFDGATAVNELVWNMLYIQSTAMDSLTAAIFKNHNDDDQKRVLRMISDQLGLAPMINAVRRYVDQQVDPRDNEARMQAENIGSWLLGKGASAVPFHTSLASVYQNIRFENYKPNIEAQARDEALLTKEVDQCPGEGTIIDLGCGTGRLSNRLSELGYASIIGIDNSEVQIAKAKEADKGSQVSYVQASWKDTHLGESSSRLVYALGRSLPHVEHERELRAVLREVNRILEDGGTFFFDMPDPDKGSYLKNRQLYLENLRSIGVPVDEAAQGKDPLLLVETVVDSPDGINFYNRFVPSMEHLESMLKIAGFDLEEVSRARIKDGDEAETVYFRATKKQHPIKPSWLPQSEDDE